MANEQVQEKLCTEPKETPAEALQFAIAFEDELKREKSYGYIIQEPKVKEEPICAVSSSNPRVLEMRCGEFYPRSFETNLKELRSFLALVNQFNKFISNLAAICFPFRSNIKRDVIWKWTEAHEKAFKRVNEEVRKKAELTHFKRNKPLKIICDASKQGLEAVLQQCEENNWTPLAYASRF